jgi:hypothetical protein
MGYPTRRCTCGAEHECPSLDPRENGRKRHRKYLEAADAAGYRIEGLSRKAEDVLDDIVGKRDGD